MRDETLEDGAVSHTDYVRLKWSQVTVIVLLAANLIGIGATYQNITNAVKNNSEKIKETSAALLAERLERKALAEVVHVHDRQLYAIEAVRESQGLLMQELKSLKRTVSNAR